jgi:undecaprenyl diphosphate synthase
VHRAVGSARVMEPTAEIPRAVAIIMDGNGRWAQRQGLPVAEGHQAGTRALRRTVEASIDLGIESLAVYAFSTENWARSVDEVQDLMEIFEETIVRELPDLTAQGVRTRFIGRRDRAPRELQARRRTAGSRSGSRSTTGAGPSWSRLPGRSSRQVSLPPR